MKAFPIENTKNFMSHLLIKDTFKDFLLEEAVIKTYNTFTIDGRIIPEFYDDYEFSYEFSKWEDIKSVCFDLIKGKTTPVGFSFILQLKPDILEQIIKEAETNVSTSLIKSFSLNIRYTNSQITVISAISLNTFIPDKTPDILWDNYVERFLNTIS